MPVLVDGAQSVGAIPVDCAGVDFYTVSGQKWLCGPDGTGALIVADPERLRVAGPATSRSGLRAGRDVRAEGRCGALRPELVGLPQLVGLARGGRPSPRVGVRACRGADRALPRAARPARRAGARGRDARRLPAARRAGRDRRAAGRQGVSSASCRAGTSFAPRCGWWTSEDDLQRLAVGVSLAPRAEAASAQPELGARSAAAPRRRSRCARRARARAARRPRRPRRGGHRRRTTAASASSSPTSARARRARRPHEPAGVHEPGELVAGEERPLQRRVARHARCSACDRTASISSSG